MDDLGVRFIHNVAKEYPDMIKITVYHEPKLYMEPKCTKRDKHLVDDSTYLPTISSISRTKTLIKDIIICNDFDYFCTFTFDPKKINSFSYGKCLHSMSTWLHHQADRSRERHQIFKYLVVPERHKSGRWHFHALISGYTGSLRPSKVKTGTGRPVYNITSFRSGFTTATPIDDAEAVGFYVSKYITKDFIKTFNQRRFFASRNLIRPVKRSNTSILKHTLPIFKQRVAGNDYYTQYLLPGSPKFYTKSGGLAPLDRRSD